MNANHDELPVSLAPAGRTTELETLVVEPAPAVSLTPRQPAADRTPPTTPVFVPAPEPEPDLPDLFSTDLFADAAGTAGTAGTAAPTPTARGGGFLPPPALVPADAPDLPMNASNSSRAAAPVDAPPADGAARRPGRRGLTAATRPKAAKEPKAAKGAPAEVAADPDGVAPAPVASGPRRRPSWLLPALLAGAVVVGGIVLLNGRNNDTSTVKSPVTTARRPTTSAAATVSTSAVATTTIPTSAASTVASSAAPPTATTAAAPPTVAVTVAPTDAPVPVPSDFPPPSVVTGTGNRTFKINLTQTSAVILEATHKGTRNFIVKALDAKGGTLAVPINQVGAFNGSVVLDPAASLQITADGAWSVTIKPLLSARQIIGSGPASGKGSEVVLYVGPAAKATVSHSGQRTFSIEMRTKTETTVIVNEVGSYQGSVDLPEGITVLAIVADGAWTLNPS